MSELSLSSLKLGQAAKDHEEKKMKERKRNLMLLVKHYLYEEGYVETLRCFDSEARVPENLVVCDNVDLQTILQEYETYYHMKFNRYLKICRRENSDGTDVLTKTLRNMNRPPQKNSFTDGTEKKKTPLKKAEENNKTCSKEVGGGDANDLLSPHLSITSYGNVSSPRESNTQPELNNIKLLKPLSSYQGMCEDWKTYANLIAKEIIQEDLSVRWDEVIGLEEAKNVLKEAIVYPVKYPQLFGKVLEPWRGLLLYGPPGTGKTLLAKAVATECNTAFFNISASTIVSKWRGDSEKLVRVMFEMARHQAPSTVFLDELDALASRRGSSSEHEASRRLKAELLTQLDGLKASSGVFLLAASNMPWELDAAILRRLEKKIMVNLPTAEARKQIFKHYLPKMILQQPKLESHLDYDALSQRTEGYSGSDIRLASKEAVMESMRHVFDTLENKQINSTDLAFKAVSLKRIETADVLRAVEKTRPTSHQIISKYEDWESQHDRA